MKGVQTQLVPNRIEAVSSISPVRMVTVPNGCDATYALCPSQRRWVWKATTGANDVLAEALGWLLSREIGVPTPNAASTRFEGEQTWLSEVVPLAHHWSPPRFTQLSQPDHLGAMLALDAIIGNTDRHAGNVLCVDGANGIDVYSIDVAASWVGTPGDIATRGMDTPGIEKLIRGIHVEVIRAGAIDAANRAAGIDRAKLGEFVREACGLARDLQVKLLTDTMVTRCAAAVQLTEKHLKNIERSRP
jgi:hypothetical protein